MALIGIDWGSSSFRAYLFSDTLDLLETHEADCGIKFIEQEAFAETLTAQIGSWRAHGNDTLLLSGMITSRSGWVETPYLDCPASPRDILANVVNQKIDQAHLYFLPGLCQKKPHADVMRGEELQLLGAALETTQSQLKQWVVLPGTHSKWALVENGSVQRFHTIATGELFEVILQHSLIGQLASKTGWCDVTFSSAVEQAFTDTQLLTQLFSARAGVLLKILDPDQVRPYLSGLLIGSEIREGVRLMKPAQAERSSQTIRLIGTSKLCSRYLEAFRQVQVLCDASAGDTAQAGFRKLFQTLTPSSKNPVAN